MKGPDELELRRQEAQSAMETPAHKEARRQKIESLEKRRQEAKRAMESQDQRARREAQEKAIREQQAALDQAEREAREGREAAARGESEKSERERLKEREKSATHSRRLGSIRDSAEEIEKLKQTAEVSLKPLRTLQTDMELAAKREALSAAKMALAEQAKRRQAPPPAPGADRRNSLIGWLAAFLILAGLGAGGWLWYSGLVPFLPAFPALPFLPQKITSVKPARLSNQLIFSEAEASIETATQTKAGILTAIRGAGADLGGQWNVEHIYLTKDGKILSWAEASSLLGLELPAPLTRSLSGEYMLGVYRMNGEPRRFLALRSTLPGQSYAGLLSWETAMPRSLLPLLRDNPPQLTTETFKDRLVQNQDARVLAKDGQDLLFYAFLDGNTIIFTPDEASFTEIFKLVAGGR